MHRHPILKNIRCSPDRVSHYAEERPATASGCGIASDGGRETQLRTTQREDRAPKAIGPGVDLFRDPSSRMDEERDLRYKSAAAIALTEEKVSPEHFDPDLCGSAGQRLMEASKLHRDGMKTRDAERYQHDTYVKHLLQLICRPDTALGMLYINDFFCTMLEQAPSHSHAMQHMVFLNHTTEPTLRRLLKNITDKDEEGNLKNQWLLSLMGIMDMIFRDEHSPKEKLTALLTVTNELALSFSKKATGGFPTTDKLAKTHTYFRRIILGLLSLAESLGCYKHNYVVPRAQKRAKTEVEPSDESYMFSLKGALEAPESDEDEESQSEEEEWRPSQQSLH